MKRAACTLLLLLLLLPTLALAQGPRTLVLQTAATTGNGATLNVTGYSVVSLAITGTTAGTDRVVTFKSSVVPGATPEELLCRNAKSGATATSQTTSGTTLFQWVCPVAGMADFLAPVTGGTTGGVTVTASALPQVSYVPPASGTTTALADPTGTVGLTAVNGTALTALRSDGAPALSQAIVPTWSGQHTFSVNPLVSNAAPGLVLTDTTASAKSLTVAVDANLVDFRESAGGGGTLLQLDLVNHRVGIGLNGPQAPLDVQGVDGNQSFLVRNTATVPNITFFPIAGAGGLLRIQDSDGATKVEFTGYGTSYFNAGSLCVGAATCTEKIDATGNINASGVYKVGGVSGVSSTATVCASGACATTCTLIFTGGIRTGGTC